MVIEQHIAGIQLCERIQQETACFAYAALPASDAEELAPEGDAE